MSPPVGRTMSNLALYMTSVLIWGSTWFAIEFQLGTVAPEVSVVYRYAIAAGLLFAWCIARGKRLAFSRRDHAWFALLGLLLFCLNYVLAYRSQIFITSALAAIVFSTILWMNILNARLLLGVRSTPKILVGAVLGIAGIVILFAPQVGELSFDDAAVLGSVLALGGAFVASLGNIASQQAQKQKLPVLQSNAWGMLYGCLFSAVIAGVAGFDFTFDFSAGYVISLAYLAVFGSVIAFGAYLTLLGRIGAHRAGYAMVLFPVVALTISALFEGLELTPSIFTGAALVIAGNLFVLQRAPRKAPETVPAEPALDPASGRGT